MKDKIPRCGVQRYVKIGTHSGQRVYIRPCKSRRGTKMEAGCYVDFKLTRDRYEKWQGPLVIDRVDDGIENRLFLSWV